MKKLDLISKRIAISGVVLCGLLLSASLLMFSLGNVMKSQASETVIVPQSNLKTPAVAGEIMMAPYIYQGDNSFGVLVWNTVTGKSQRYYLTDGAFVKKVNLPANPLE